MATATYSATQSGKGQAANRVSRNWRDQHGRVWNAVVSIRDKSGHPCSPLAPAMDPATQRPWSAPVLPDQQYFILPAAEDADNIIRIDYARWLDDLDRYSADWDKTIDNACLGYANGNQQLYARLRRNPTTAILGMAGPKPLDRRYVLACQAGDRWALGLDPVFPAWAVKIWGTPDKVLPANRSQADDYDFLNESADADAAKELKRRRGRPRRRAANEEELNG